MAAEFKLSFTGSQVNEKLRKIDSLVSRNELLNKNGILRQDVLPEGYPYITEGVVLPETAIAADEDGNIFITEAFKLDSDSTYTVTYNGIEYKCATIISSMDGIDAVVLGNFSMLGDTYEPTDEPFILINLPDDGAAMYGAYGILAPLDGATEVTISISGKIIKKIDKNLLPKVGPNNLVDGSGVSSVRTTAASDVIGHYASALGRGVTALGDYSHAEGSSTDIASNYISTDSTNDEIIEAWKANKFTLANGLGSHVEGSDTIALGQFSHAEGDGTVASGWDSHAEGSGTTAFGDTSHAEGVSSNKAFDYITSASTNSEIITAWEENKFTLAKSGGSHAEGCSTLAIGNSAHAEGYENIASGNSSHVEGSGNVSSGNNSHTEGYLNTASGINSHAEGEGTIAASPAQHVQGRYNVPDTESEYAHIIGNGSSEHIQRNIHTIDWEGKGWFAGGVTVGKEQQPVATEQYVADNILDFGEVILTVINNHNTTNISHKDIRLLIDGLTTRLNALADSDDTTLDQLSEIVAYIKSNKSLIESVTTNKVNVSDIIDNLTTNVANKPLSAAQGVALKALIDAITVPTKTSQLTNDSGYLTSAPVTSVNGKTGAVSLTASDVGALPSTTNIPSIAGLATETYVNTQVGTKVDKITGKVLSTNDYTNDDKAKLTNTNIAYGTCSTAADVAEKAVVLTGNTQWSLTNGSIIMVKFDISNTAENVTINVNNTGAYPIWYNNAEYTSTGTAYTGYAKRTIAYMFNGTHYVWITASYDSNTTYSNAGLGSGYATCSTAAATVAKTASLSSYALTTGGIVSVKFTNDVPANATLSINSKTAKNIYFRGAKITDGVIKAGDVATFVYSSYYHLISIDRWQNDITEIKSDAYKASIVDAVLEALPTWTGGSY